MSEPKWHVPQRWWWAVAIAVPLLSVAITASPKFIEIFKGAPTPISSGVVIESSDINADDIVGGDLHEGDSIRTEIALSFGAGSPDLSPEDQAILEGAMERLRVGDYDGAIPILKAIAERAPTAPILNNLAAAHLAVGETVAAQGAIEKARNLGGEPDLAIEAALNWNERRLVKAHRFGIDPVSSINATEWEGIEAFLTRVEETGGMVTIEAIYRNVTTEPIQICPWLSYAYVIDEGTGERWDDSFNSDTGCPTTIDPAGSLPVWVKFAVDVAEHPRLTIILSDVLPFENITPVIGGAR